MATNVKAHTRKGRKVKAHTREVYYFIRQRRHDVGYTKTHELLRDMTPEMAEAYACGSTYQPTPFEGMKVEYWNDDTYCYIGLTAMDEDGEFILGEVVGFSKDEAERYMGCKPTATKV